MHSSQKMEYTNTPNRYTNTPNRRDNWNTFAFNIANHIRGMEGNLDFACSILPHVRGSNEI